MPEWEYTLFALALQRQLARYREVSVVAAVTRPPHEKLLQKDSYMDSASLYADFRLAHGPGGKRLPELKKLLPWVSDAWDQTISTRLSRTDVLRSAMEVSSEETLIVSVAFAPGGEEELREEPDAKRMRVENSAAAASPSPPPPPSTQPPPSKDDTFLSMCVMRVFGSKAYVAALATADFADGSTTMATIGSTPKFGSWVFHAAASAAAASSTSAPNIDIFTVPSLFGEYRRGDSHRDSEFTAVNWYYRKGFKDATYHATQKGRQGRQRVEGVRVDSKTLRMFLPILHRTKEDKFDLFVEHYADKIIVLHASMEASDSKIVKYVANHADFEARHREGEKVVTTNRRWLLARHRLDGGDVVDKPLNVHRQFTSKLKKYLQNSENKVIGRFWRTLDTNQSLSLAVYYGFAEDVLKLS